MPYPGFLSLSYVHMCPLNMYFHFILNITYMYFFSQHQCFLGMSAVTLNIFRNSESLGDIILQVWLCSI